MRAIRTGSAADAQKDSLESLLYLAGDLGFESSLRRLA